MKFLFGMCDCTVYSDGLSEFFLMLEILHVYGYVHVRSHVSPGMDCVTEGICLEGSK